MKINFIGPSYQERSPNLDMQRSRNVYPVKTSVGDSKEVTAMYGAPGKTLFCTLPQGGCRGELTLYGRGFAVYGNGLYEIFADKTFILRGTLLTNTGPCQLAYNGFQLCVVDGPNGYIQILGTNAFSLIVSPGWLGSYTVTFVDGYFIFVDPGTGIYYISALYDGNTEDPLDFASAEGSADHLTSAIELHRQLVLVGTNTTQFSYDAGGSLFPFSDVQGAFVEYGSSVASTVLKTANSVFFIGSDDDGQGIVWQITAYQPQRVSTFAIEYLLQQEDLSTITGYSYQEDGHYMIRYNLPNSNTTIVYDITEQEWHEVAWWNVDTGEFERDRGESHMFVFGKHLVGDYQNGNLYEQSLNIYNDNGGPLRLERIFPHAADTNTLFYIFWSRLWIDMQTGIGLESGPDEDIDPEIVLSYTDDSASWSNERAAKVGKIGERKTRVLWNRLGRSRDRVYKIVFTANCKRAFIGANATVRKGIN